MLLVLVLNGGLNILFYHYSRDPWNGRRSGVMTMIAWKYADPFDDDVWMIVTSLILNGKVPELRRFSHVISKA